MVIDEGVLFRTTETAFVQTKRKLLDDCDLWCIVSLPPGVFSSAGAGVKTNLLFFTKGGPTERVWYYDLSDVKVTKKQPLTLDRFDEFFELLPSRADSEHSWTVTRDEIEAPQLRPQGGQPERQVQRGHADAGGAARHHRGAGAARWTRRSPSCADSSRTLEPCRFNDRIAHDRTGMPTLRRTAGASGRQDRPAGRATTLALQ